MALVLLTPLFLLWVPAAQAGQATELQRQVKDAMLGAIYDASKWRWKTPRQSSPGTFRISGPKTKRSSERSRSRDRDGGQRAGAPLRRKTTTTSPKMLRRPYNGTRTTRSGITSRTSERRKVLPRRLVTPDRQKANELFERVAKIKGVQDVQSEIQTLSPSQSDRNLRNSFQRQLAANTHFERVARMVNPPFHIIVNNGIVVLVGYVQTQIEIIEMQRITLRPKVSCGSTTSCRSCSSNALHYIVRRVGLALDTHHVERTTTRSKLHANPPVPHRMTVVERVDFGKQEQILASSNDLDRPARRRDDDHVNTKVTGLEPLVDRLFESLDQPRRSHPADRVRPGNTSRG